MIRPAAMAPDRLAAIAARLRDDKRVRRAMPVWGRLNVDRLLPFIVVYRKPAKRGDPGTYRLAIGAASYLLASGDPVLRENVVETVRAVAEVMREAFGAFLIIEVWAGPEADADLAPQPGYRVVYRNDESMRATVDEFVDALRSQRIGRRHPDVEIDTRSRIAPKGMRPLFTARQLDTMGTSLLGLETRPVYRDPRSGDIYPVLIRQLARRVSTAIDRAAYRFTHTHTTARPPHFNALGKRAVVQAVWEIDERLSAIGDLYDALLQVTPVNAEKAFADFRRSRYQRKPTFQYRPLPVDPGRLKHDLWSVRPERVEDPTLMYLFRDVQTHLDRQISLLAEIETPAFLHTSLQLHGGVEPGLLATARLLLDSLPRRSRGRRAPRISAEEFAGLATAEVLGYRERDADFGALPEVREDIYSGLLVSKGRMYIGSEARIPLPRADALIQHEVGTHVVTYYNGVAQRLKLLHVGLPGYDELQEGLAVLGEYLVGGLDADRMRVLAARVVAVHAMTDGASFVESFRLLRDYGFSAHAAFTITTRVYRGGGLAKDAMYLRGLAGVLDYVAEGCDFGRLFLGKYGMRHVDVIDELLLRGVLSHPRVLPRYLERADVRVRLERVQDGATVTDIASECGGRSV